VDVRDAVHLIPVENMSQVVAHALLDRPTPADVMKYAHFDAVLLPGLETGWQSPPAPAG
jgi:hypothetical protein